MTSATVTHPTCWVVGNNRMRHAVKFATVDGEVWTECGRRIRHPEPADDRVACPRCAAEVNPLAPVIVWSWWDGVAGFVA
jgi:hypothetical protein